jgi:Tol biopolymer transport system component
MSRTGSGLRILLSRKARLRHRGHGISIALLSARMRRMYSAEPISGSLRERGLSTRRGVCSVAFALATIFVSGLIPAPVLRAQGGCTPGTVMSPGGTGVVLETTAVSGDGRYLAFSSSASDLVPGDGNATLDVFVFDRSTCTTENVSVTSAEGLANGASVFPAISRDGRFVAFLSAATNLGPTADTNNAPDVFVRDRLNGITLLVSAAFDGGWANTTASESGPLTISGNGQFVAFWSNASNLVSGDTNGNTDLFVRDVAGGVTTRVSVATGGVQGNGVELIGQVSMLPALSDDGRYVGFSSSKTDLVPGDSNGTSDVFRHDRQTGVTVRVSVSTGGGQLAAHSFRPAMPRDGSEVAFDTTAPAVPGDANGTTDVFLHNVLSGTTTRVSLVSHGGEVNGESFWPSLSGDGRYVSFMSFGSNLVVGDTAEFSDIYVYDRTTNITRRISASAGGIPSNGISEAPRLSDDGAFVSFESGATNLGPADPDGPFRDAFVTRWRSVAAQPDINLLRNGDFAAGFNRWIGFALPEADDLIQDTTGGVLKFYRATGSTQAVVLQGTGGQLPAFAPITASFRLANSSAGRKRISVLIHDGDFSDLSVCTFFLDGFAPMQTYGLRTHTTQPWFDATISVYAATDDGTPSYQVDDVSLSFTPAASDTGTDCTDPTTPVSGGSPGPNLLVNGDFSNGMQGWTTFGQIVGQVAAGVFEFYRPAGNPAGVVLQPSGQAMTNDTTLTASFKLGNSSSVRRRVTVLLHDLDFSDLNACTFWLPPGLPLSSYTVRTFTTEAWTNATVSFYGATVSTEPWVQLDDVELRRTPGAGPIGTACGEPDLSLAQAAAMTVQGAAVQGFNAAAVQAPTGANPTAGGQPAVSPATIGDLVPAGQPRFPLQLWLAPHDETLDIQVSADGDTWVTVASFDPSEEWVFVELEAIGGLQVRLRPRR